MNLITIRDERAGDAAAIRDLHTAAFGCKVEAGIVDRLRESCPDLVSLVAVDGERVVGHVLFSPGTVDAGPAGMGLAPLASCPTTSAAGSARPLSSAASAPFASSTARSWWSSGTPAIIPASGSSGRPRTDCGASGRASPTRPSWRSCSTPTPWRGPGAWCATGTSSMRRWKGSRLVVLGITSGTISSTLSGSRESGPVPGSRLQDAGHKDRDHSRPADGDHRGQNDVGSRRQHGRRHG